jgi:hypothetical protein
MKKFALVAGVMVIASGAAFAFSVGVPFFADSAATGSSAALPSDGQRAFIGLHNNTYFDIVVTLSYFTSTGTPLFQASVDGIDTDNDGDIDSYPTVAQSGAQQARNTSIIPAMSTVSFRPASHDVAQESGTAQDFPNRPSWFNTKKNGSVAISWGSSSGAIGMLGGFVMGTAAIGSTGWPLTAFNGIPGLPWVVPSMAIQGRLLEQLPTGVSAFLLPEGM